MWYVNTRSGARQYTAPGSRHHQRLQRLREWQPEEEEVVTPAPPASPTSEAEDAGNQETEKVSASDDATSPSDDETKEVATGDLPGTPPEAVEGDELTDEGNLSDMTVAELKALAEANDVELPKQARKAEIVVALEAAGVQPPEAAPIAEEAKE